MATNQIKPKIPEGFELEKSPEKTPGLPPGFVIEENPKTIYATPLPFQETEEYQRTRRSLQDVFKTAPVKEGMKKAEQILKEKPSIAAKIFKTIFPLTPKEKEVSEEIFILQKIKEERDKRNQKLLEIFYEQNPEKRPREYPNFFEDTLRNFIGGSEAGLSHALRLAAQASPGAIWDDDKLREWSYQLYQDSMGQEWGPSVKGGWKGWVSNTIGRNVPYWGSLAAIHYLTHGQTLITMGAAYSFESGEAYRTAKMYGAGDEEADLRAFVVGAIAAPIEFMQIRGLFRFAEAGKYSAKSILRRANMSVMQKIAAIGKGVTLEQSAIIIQETVEEVLQEVPHFLSEADLNPDVWDEAWERFAGAALGGGFMGLVFGAGGRIVSGRYASFSKKSLSKALQNLPEGGLLKELADNLVERASKGESIEVLEREFFTAVLTGKSSTQIQEEIKEGRKRDEQQRKQRQIVMKQLTKEMREATIKEASLEEKQAILQKYGEQLDVLTDKRLADIKTEEDVEEFAAEVEKEIEEKAAEVIKKELPKEFKTSQDIKAWGNLIGPMLGIDTTGLSWDFKIKKGKVGIDAYVQFKKVHFLVGTKPFIVENESEIRHFWKYYGYETKIGDKIYPFGGLNEETGGDFIKRVLVHELDHVPQEITRDGRGFRYHPKEWVEKSRDDILKVKETLENMKAGEDAQKVLDEGADEAVKNIEEFLGEVAGDLDTTDFDNPFFTRLIDGMLKKFGFIDKDLNTPFVPKDFRLIKRHLWMPDYIAKKYPAFRPLYNAVRTRTVARTDLAHLLDAQFAPYSQLSTKERKGIDKVLSEADLNPKDWPKFETPKGIAKLKKAGLSDNQIEAAIAWENTFSVMDRLLLEKMKNAGIDKKLIEEYQGKHKHYIPHRWYGQWVIQVKDAEGKTIYQNATKTQISAAAIATKLKAQYPDQEVKYRKFSELPENLFQEAQQPAVKAMLNDVLKRMDLETLDVDDATKTDIKNSALAALTEAYKEKGFGRAFMKRTGVPGYTTDLLQPAAEYINGFTGYITKIDLVRNLSDGLRGMDKKNYPKLFSYALEYAKYNQGRASEFQSLKKFAYVMYLYGNVSAGALNLTQSFILGWPELSKYTGGSLVKTIQSIAEVASDSLLGSKFITQEEWNKIARFRVEGYLEPRQTLELSGATGNLWLKPLNRKISKTLKFFDIFRQMETLNREAMALALIRSGIEADTPVEASWGETIPGGQLIDSAHFRYGKENRPGLMRGITSPVMVFRSWGLHYLFWAKTQIDASIKKDGKAAGALARSATALAFFGGFSAFFPAQFITWLWRRVFRTDLEAELIESLGTLGLALSEGIPAIIPPGISFSQRVSATQIPTPRDFESWKKAIQTIGGVFTDIPIRVANMKADIALGDWSRALEDISPQALRNVLAGNRLRTEGMTKRTGTPVMNVGEKLGQLPLKLTLPESILKMLGWQPSVLSNQWKITDIMRVKTDIERKQVSNWANRWNLALMSGDKEEIKTIYNEFITWNQKMKRLGRIEDMIEFERLIEAISRRQNPNIPWPEYMDDHYKMLRKQFFGDKREKKK